MRPAIAKSQMTAADFLAWDEHEPVHHEFVRGKVYAMAGGEDRDATVVGNLYLALRATCAARRAALS